MAPAGRCSSSRACMFALCSAAIQAIDCPSTLPLCPRPTMWGTYISGRLALEWSFTLMRPVLLFCALKQPDEYEKLGSYALIGLPDEEYKTP